jgi:hypothetical protein
MKKRVGDGTQSGADQSVVTFIHDLKEWDNDVA